MRTYRTNSGPLREAVFFEPGEIENICADELRNLALCPTQPEPIRIERFIEKRFRVTPEYVDLPEGVLGCTAFGPKGVEGVSISRSLVETGTRSAERLTNSTLAHEAGHGLLHAHLFAFEQSRLTLMFGEDVDPHAPRILCRDPKPESARRGYDGRWWEFHANQAIGALLLPRPLALEAIRELLTPPSAFGRRDLPAAHREKAVEHLAEVFAVNPAAARVRVEDLFPQGEARQLTL